MLPVITLAPKKEKSLLRRHPWVFSNAISKTDGMLKSGSAVRVSDSAGAFLCYGIYSERSQIRVRALSFEEDRPIESALVQGRVRDAIARRKALMERGNRACRLVASEGDLLPGLTVDIYDTVLVISISAWSAEIFRDDIVSVLQEAFPGCAVYERSDGLAREKEGLSERCGPVLGEAPADVIYALENNTVFIPADIVGGHKTGAYLDQRDSRLHLMGLCRGKSVLNCFSYTGAFCLYALKGGAKSVVNVDVSRHALDIAKQAAAHNHLDPGRCRFIARDVFDFLRSEQKSNSKYDVIILDPPKFINSKADMQKGCRGYQDINRLALTLLSPGGRLLTFSCSGLMDPALFQKIVADAALDARVGAVVTGSLRQAEDHVVSLPCPEGFYLKGLDIQLI